jgi:hypothetical protein
MPQILRWRSGQSVTGCACHRHGYAFSLESLHDLFVTTDDVLAAVRGRAEALEAARGLRSALTEGTAIALKHSPATRGVDSDNVGCAWAPSRSPLGVMNRLE